MARRYRCLNCSVEFIADKPACVGCEIDATTDPVAQAVIVPLALIHFDPPHPKIKGRGRRVRACDPAVPIGKGRGSGEPRVVNCEACKATPEYQEAVKAGALQESFLDTQDEIVAHNAGVVITAKNDGCTGCGKE